MEKKIVLMCVVLTMATSFGACKSSDYKDAIALEESEDYEGALEIFNTITDYKDASEHAAACQEMVNAIDAFNTASGDANQKNEELETQIDEAEDLVAEGNFALDETLTPALETAISEAKADKVEVPAMAADANTIMSQVEELNAIDYSSDEENLKACKEALETSIAQYALVDAPDESYVIKCLENVEGIVDISAATEDNDPNGNLNKSGGYTAQVYFSSDLIDQSSVYGTSLVEKGTSAGGSVEVYANVDDATRRVEYLATFDGTGFASGSHTVVGTCIVRTSNNLTASQQKDLESKIIEALTTLK